jgi:hypothetical protein
MPSKSALPPPAERSEFWQAAKALHGHITEASAFIKRNQRDYIVMGR